MSFFEGHTDPAGLNFDINDLNSVATNDISSTWCNNLPNFTKRRCALTIQSNSSSCGPRKSSVDSEISVSVRQFSMESRRNSMDSQVSVKIAEVQTKVACRTHGHIKNKARSKARYNRRASSTSMESQIITSSYPTHKIGFYARKDKRMKRRSANAGIGDAEEINTLITNFPEFSRNFQGMTTTSEDDNASRSSLKIQDSRLDVVVRQDYSDEDFIAAARHNSNIRKYTNGFDPRQIHPSIHDVLQNQAALNAIQFSNENVLRSSKEGGRASKNSQKSVRSRKSSRHSLKRNRKNSKSISKGGTLTKREAATQVAHLSAMATQTVTDDVADDSSFTSYSSELGLKNAGGGVGAIQSSYSGVSVGKHSRSSKTSCDVGTQANAYEIATQTMSYDDDVDVMKIGGSTLKRSTDDRHNHDDDDLEQYTENHQLLVSMVPPPSIVTAKKRAGSIIGRRDTLVMSESEKLKMLLLPSK